MSARNSTLETAPDFLDEMAKYFERRPTNGEDRAHWSNVYNAENCRSIAAALRSLEVNVVICERNAIYVNDTRITNRNTKWGARAVLAEFRCPTDQVVKECLTRGFRRHVECIDAEPYVAQRANYPEFPETCK